MIIIAHYKKLNITTKLSSKLQLDEKINKGPMLKFSHQVNTKVLAACYLEVAN